MYNLDMKILSIDTSNNQEIKVGLEVDGKKLDMETKQVRGSQGLLELIDKIVKKGKIKLEDLDQVKVNIGPGSFTGLRVGVSVANALGYSLGIPVNNKKLETDLVY